VRPPLNLFTLLSTLSSTVSHMAQANYATGSAFLDEFARYRRAYGLPAHSI
jgi:hypothetical protein